MTPDDPIFNTDIQPWPAWVKGFRDTQVTAMALALDAYERGADVVMLDAPTGTGKTLLAEMIRRAGRFGSALYVCNTIGLQEQFLADFPYAELIKGRSNYLPLDGPAGATCADCAGKECGWCETPDGGVACPYRQARETALAAPLAVTNTAYFIAEANHVKGFSGRELVIADESDTLEGILTGYIEFRVPAKWLARLGLDEPKKGSHGATVARWVTDTLIPAVKAHKVRGHDELERAAEQRDKDTLLGACNRFVNSDIDEWVRDNDAGPVVYRPISCAAWGPELLWKHGQKWLCMSGSIISTREQVRSLGAMGLHVETVEVPMTFPRENRPIFVAPVADMSMKTQEDDLPKMVAAIENILANHPGDRVLIHCVSYRLADVLHRKLSLSTRDRVRGRAMLTYHNSRERDYAFDRYKAADGAVLFAPSMDRGFDFAGDLARVVIIAKVPFMSLGDKQVGRRLRAPGGEEWYAVQAVRTILQMTGRGVRSAEDTCATYILDRQFATNLYAKNMSLFPRWWRDGMVRGFNWKRLLETGVSA
jgi:Rad3-related DNA helicase